MALTEGEIRHVALLSRLELTQDEVKLYSKQVGKVLEYVEKLNALDTSNVEPMVTAAAGGNVFREDTPRAGLQRSEALAAAPDSDDEFFRVPPVIE